MSQIRIRIGGRDISDKKGPDPQVLRKQEIQCVEWLRRLIEQQNIAAIMCDAQMGSDRFNGQCSKPARMAKDLDAVLPLFETRNPVRTRVGPKDERIPSGAPVQHIVAGAANQVIVAFTAIQRIIAGATPKPVVPGAPRNKIVIRPAIQTIVEIPTSQSSPAPPNTLPVTAPCAVAR